jgi:hypothetical protein
MLHLLLLFVEFLIDSLELNENFSLVVTLTAAVNSWKNTWVITIVDKIAKVISKFERKFLTVLRLFNWEVLVHWIGGQVLEIVEQEVAGNDPANFEVIGKLYWRLFITHEELLFEVGVRLTLH